MPRVVRCRAPAGAGRTEPPPYLRYAYQNAGGAARRGLHHASDATLRRPLGGTEPAAARSTHLSLGRAVATGHHGQDRGTDSEPIGQRSGDTAPVCEPAEQHQDRPQVVVVVRGGQWPTAVHCCNAQFKRRLYEDALLHSHHPTSLCSMGQQVNYFSCSLHTRNISLWRWSVHIVFLFGIFYDATIRIMRAKKLRKSAINSRFPKNFATLEPTP